MGCIFIGVLGPCFRRVQLDSQNRSSFLSEFIDLVGVSGGSIVAPAHHGLDCPRLELLQKRPTEPESSHEIEETQTIHSTLSSQCATRYLYISTTSTFSPSMVTEDSGWFRPSELNHHLFSLSNVELQLVKPAQLIKSIISFLCSPSEPN